MKIKVIDLLNIMADGKDLPEKFMYNEHLYYRQETKGICYRCDELDEIFEDCLVLEDLNNYVEIIEEPKKIKKIRIDHNSINIDKAFETGTTTFFREKDIEIFQCLSSKINELIDEINNLKEK